MPFTLAAFAIDSGTVLWLITLLAVPFAAITFARSGEAYRSIGKGPLAIEQELPLPRYLNRPDPAIDPAMQAAEVRQMLEAKSDRRRRRGEEPLDVGAETARLLEVADTAAAPDAELRSEVRQIVVAGNQRRLRKGLQPLDVEAETDRQLADFVGSP